jgi:hypothetical protein
MPIERTKNKARHAKSAQLNAVVDFHLPRPATKERGEGWGEGRLVKIEDGKAPLSP